MMSATLIADAQANRVFDRFQLLAQLHCPLNVDGAAHRVDNAGKLNQQAVAGGLDDPPAMLVDFRVGDFAPDRLERKERSLFVLAHQPGIADDIGRQNCRQPAFGARFCGNVHALALG